MRLPTMRTAFAATAATTVLLLTAACGSDAENSDTSSSSSATPESESSSDSSSESASGDYADGSYDAEGSYSNPGGESSVKVALTLAGGKVTEVEVTPEASGTSLQYQEKFASGIADEVVGKSLDDLDVSKVSGSSLTSGGFNAALEEIKSEASA